MTQVAQQLAAAREAPQSALVAAWARPGRSSGGGLAALLGDVDAQLALSLAALLPWLSLHFRHSPHTPLAALCILVRGRHCRGVLGWAQGVWVPATLVSCNPGCWAEGVCWTLAFYYPVQPSRSQPWCSIP